MDVDIGTIGTIVGVVVSIIGAAIWLGSIHSRVSAQESKIVRLEEVAETVHEIHGCMKAVMATLETIQEELHRRRPGGRNG